MNIWDILILLLVAGLVFLALRAIRSGKSGGCHHGSACDHNCAACGKSCGGQNKTDRS